MIYNVAGTKKIFHNNALYHVREKAKKAESTTWKRQEAGAENTQVASLHSLNCPFQRLNTIKLSRTNLDSLYFCKCLKSL